MRIMLCRMLRTSIFHYYRTAATNIHPVVVYSNHFMQDTRASLCCKMMAKYATRTADS